MPGFWDRAKFDPKVLELKQEQNHATQALILFCKHLKLDFKASDLHGEGFGWLHENYPTLPVHMEVTKEKLNVVDFWLRPTTTSAWRAYFDLAAELRVSAPLGMMLQISGVGFGVIHTGWNLPAAPGHTRMERRSATSDHRGLILETLPSFAESVLKVWQP
jgi:hypothetical protein